MRERDVNLYVFEIFPKQAKKIEPVKGCVVDIGVKINPIDKSCRIGSEPPSKGRIVKSESEEDEPFFTPF